MSIGTNAGAASLGRLPALSPLLALGAALLAVPLLLALPLRLPIGPMYWDVVVYYDAANRILGGQVPVVDFFTPVGPLGYYLFTGWLTLFPDAQPTLIAHWSILALTAPLMALVVREADRGSRAIAFALLVPFLVFALLPFNTREFYPYPGSDGFGIYNRQVCQILYPLVAALVFARRPAILAVVVFAAMTALFFLKITGFVAGAMICLYAFATGRLMLRHTVTAALGFLAVLGAVELLAGGLVSQYVADILTLARMNAGGLVSRFTQALSHTAGVVLPGAALIALLLWQDRAALAGLVGRLAARRDLGAGRQALDHDGLWLGIVLFAGVFFETQNTGSQAMIFAWPVFLAILVSVGAHVAAPNRLLAVLALSAAAAFPPLVNTVERAVRTYGGAIKNVSFEHENLKALGALTMRPDVAERAEKFIDFYPRHRETYAEIAAMGQLPGFITFSDFDFQITHLQSADRAVTAIEALEAERGVRFETMMALNFVNPYPWLMDRAAPLHIAIGADPTRAVPPPGDEVAEAVRTVDLALLPTCPPTSANRRLLALYQPFLAEHQRIVLDPCTDAFVHPRFEAALR